MCFRAATPRLPWIFLLLCLDPRHFGKALSYTHSPRALKVCKEIVLKPLARVIIKRYLTRLFLPRNVNVENAYQTYTKSFKKGRIITWRYSGTATLLRRTNKVR